MNFKFLFIIVFLFSYNLSQAQLLKKLKKRAENAVERKLEEKVEKETSRTMDSVLNPSEKTKKQETPNSKTRTIQTTVNYNPNFKPGWNLIKTEVIGKYQLEHERGLDKSWFKSHRHSVIEGIPKNITYFFRKTPY